MDREIEVLLRAGPVLSRRVLAVKERHVLNQPGRVDAKVAFPEETKLSSLLGQPAELVIGSHEGQTRRFRGVIEEVAVEGTPSEELESRVAPVHELSIVSTLGLLERSVDSRIFQEKTTQEIVTEVLDLHGLSNLEWNLTGSYPTRIYCTQYNESALHFIGRLLEEDGIYFYVITTEEGEEKIVFADDSPSAESSPSEVLPLRRSSGQNAEGAAVYTIETSEQIFTGKHSLNSFDFQRPDLSLECAFSDDRWDELESYSVSENFFEPSEGQRRAELRQKEARAAATHRRLTTDSLEINVGHLVAVDNYGSETEYFVTQFELTYVQDGRNSGAHSDASGDALSGAIPSVVGSEASADPKATAPGGHDFSILATAIDAKVPFVPPRRHSRPRILGPQTATVVAPSGTEPEGLHTDKYGRVKVQFHWDRYGKFDDSASCWMRVGQLQTSGSMILPRVNWEVVVEFLEGDPDRPLVSGRLFNGRFMPPYQLPEGRTRTSLQTSSSPGGGGTNEIRLEDAAGAEEVMIHSQYNTIVNAANNRKKTVQKNWTQVVGNNSACTVGADQTVQITGGFESTVGADQSLSVGGNRTCEVNAVYGLTVGGSSSTSISGNWISMIGSPLDALIALGAAKAASVASEQAEHVFNEVSGAAQGAVSQALGPIQGLMDQAQGIQSEMDAVAEGKLSASAGVLGGAIALPTAADLTRAIGQGPAFGRAAEGTETSTGGIALGSAISSAVSGTLSSAGGAAKNAIGEALGTGGGEAGGQSQENVSGPEGALSGFSESDTTAGPGYSQYKVAGDHSETVGGNRIAASVEATNFNITGNMSEDVGAAHIELIVGDRAESVEAASSETSPGLVVVAKGGEVHTVQGAQQLNIGGALMETVKGDYSIEAGASAALTGSMHDIKAKSKLTIQCGASSIVIDGSGITIQTPTLSLTGSGVKATKAVSDG